VEKKHRKTYSDYYFEIQNCFLIFFVEEFDFNLYLASLNKKNKL